MPNQDLIDLESKLLEAVDEARKEAIVDVKTGIADSLCTSVVNLSTTYIKGKIVKLFSELSEVEE